VLAEPGSFYRLFPLLVMHCYSIYGCISTPFTDAFLLHLRMYFYSIDGRLSSRRFLPRRGGRGEHLPAHGKKGCECREQERPPRQLHHRQGGMIRVDLRFRVLGFRVQLHHRQGEMIRYLCPCGVPQQVFFRSRLSTPFSPFDPAGWPRHIQPSVRACQREHC
jgi:hypothetical protein